MDTSEFLNDGVTSLISQVRAFDDLQSLEENLGDGLSILGDTSTLLALTKGIYNLYEKNKFEAYLVQLFIRLHEKGKYSKEEEQNFNKYLKNKRNIHFIAETIDSCFHSHSIKCSALLGYFVGGIISKQLIIDYRDQIVITALRNLVDDDLSNFKFIYEFVKGHPELYEELYKSKSNKPRPWRIVDIRKQIEESGFRPENIEITIEKLKNVQAIAFDSGGFTRVGNAWGVFLFTENSDYLYNIIENFYVANNSIIDTGK